ncbi:unnamed protein product [Owenia fusiformis]|uniref:Uncharacterized protein n=1 Tax=Owenia fusiformis TaxID=6347 RepID=A0A8J1XQ81_OWEFU|nr:unnamed protein product [Owenia fusiformis]
MALYRDNKTVQDEMLYKWKCEQDELKQNLSTKDTFAWQMTSNFCNEEKEREPPSTPNPCQTCDPSSHAQKTVLQYIGGVDISFVKGDDVNACSALVVIALPSLEVVYEDYEMIQLDTPYIPGYLAFREVPFLVEAFDRLKAKAPQFIPQVVLVDGNGILHPKGFGLASHLGVLIDIPTIGVAKNFYATDGLLKDEAYQEKVKQLETGQGFPLFSTENDVLGQAYLPKTDFSKPSKPIYISIGHNISLETAIWVVQLLCQYRVPEPTRQADIRSREVIRKWIKSHNPSQDISMITEN